MSRGLSSAMSSLMTRGGSRSAAARSSLETPRAVQEAREAQRCWAQVPVTERLAVLRRLRRQIAASGLAAGADDLAARVARSGAVRSPGEILTSEVIPLVEALRFLEREAVRLLASRRPGADGRPWWLWGVDLEIHREPLGVVLVVGPSNYPLFLPGVQTVQALAAGNAVLLKPGRGGSSAALRLARLLAEAGLPEGLLTVLPEAPEAVHEALAAGIDKVVLTGSAATGRAVLAELAPRLVPATLELSGCDAAFVREDADVDRVVDALTFGLRLNGGATCIAPRRAFVHVGRAPELASRLGRAAAALPVVAVAPEVARRARELVREALDLGARSLSLDGAGLIDALRADGFPAVVLADVPPEAPILREDLFAPILSLVSVSGDEEALRRDETCPYALGASVFGTEAGAEALARRIRAGVVVVNDLIVPTADPRLPFGGRGESGFGVTRGAEGLLEMTVPKAVAVRRPRAGRLRHLEPLTTEDEPLFRAFLAFAHGGLRTRFHGAVALLRNLLRRAVGRVASQPVSNPASPDKRTKMQESPAERTGREPEEVGR